ncbi:uncharacterized protein BDV17DRAFT_264550 [Aspergillus undulatus]|uniref:uncharacterized protein n=1 Tax=Aspergillus undulatus TaxID=1810928 RepID=UPI003CCD6605
MKLSSATVVLGLLPLALAKSVLVTYPKGTPDDVIDAAKEDVKKDGGTITHEYNLVLHGFSANIQSEETIQRISTQSSQYPPTVEEDQPVSIS